MDIGSAALVVIDMQNGFVNHHSRHAVPAVSDLIAQWSTADRRQMITAGAAYLSIGNAPTAPSGDLTRGVDGYCPPADQHPRVIVAGDLRSTRFQRIMTALGSGSEAALHAYYAAREPLAKG